jgi:hypothetical protein
MTEPTLALWKLAVELKRVHGIALIRKAELEVARTAYETAREVLNAAFSDENIARRKFLDFVTEDENEKPIPLVHIP